MSPEDPRHGTNAGHHAGCRQRCCAEARNRYERNRRKLSEVGRPLSTDPLGARRRIQALMVLGWPGRVIAERSGLASQQVVDNVLREVTYIHSATAQAIARTYDELSMSLGPSPITRARAIRNGWLPPLAWDDDRIDDPTYTPRLREPVSPRYDYDPVVVERFLAGDYRIPTSVIERREIVRRWTGTHGDLARLTGWKPERYTSEDVA